MNSLESKSIRSQRGFTLLEVVVAVAIFAVISLIAYVSISNLLSAQQHIQASAERLKRVQLAVAQIDRELRGLANRPVRDGFSSEQAALVGGLHSFEFTHSSPAELAGQRRAQLTRSAYVFAQSKLLRARFNVLDKAPSSLPVKQEMLEQVDDFQLRYLDAEQRWFEQWPPISSNRAAAQALPVAVEYRLRVQGFGEITRLVILPRSPSLPKP